MSVHKIGEKVYTDWFVNVYDKDETLIDWFEILNQTASEAEGEAIKEIALIADADDWTLTEIS